MNASVKTLSRLNQDLRLLCDGLKALNLSASFEFPAVPTGRLQTLECFAEVQSLASAYARALLLRIFQTVPLTRSSAVFVDLWQNRGKSTEKVEESERQLDIAVRKLLKKIADESVILSEEDLIRGVGTDDEIAEMLYYLSTLQGDLCWYMERYLGRMHREKS